MLTLTCWVYLLWQEQLLLSVLPAHVAVKMRQDLGTNQDGQLKKIYMSRHENVRSVNNWDFFAGEWVLCNLNRFTNRRETQRYHVSATSSSRKREITELTTFADYFLKINTAKRTWIKKKRKVRPRRRIIVASGRIKSNEQMKLSNPKYFRPRLSSSPIGRFVQYFVLSLWILTCW